MFHSHSSRRRFLHGATAVAGGVFIPSFTRAGSPNDRFQLAQIGVGGMGGNDLKSLANHPKVEVVGLCDVDRQRLSKAGESYPSAQTFVDFREMFHSLGDGLDGVVVSVPDHTHASAAVLAMRAGKAVYCQKPLAHQVHETRVMREVAQKEGVVTQMGIQIHSHVAYRMATAMIQEGAIGKVNEVIAWSAKKWGYDGPAFDTSDPVPEHLEWNHWLGVADQRPYVKGKYHPFQWRRLLDFGTGTLGDMGVHIFDTPFRALELTAPLWVKTTCREPTGVGHPMQNKVEYEFPQTRYTTKGFRWTWTDGPSAIPDGAGWGLPEGMKVPDQGALFVGEEGNLLLPHVSGPLLLPRDKFEGRARPDIKKHVDHYHQWVDTVYGTDTCSADFAYGGQLTEALLLGVVGNRFPGQQLTWDADKMRFPGHAEATALLRRPYREGFQVEGL